MGLYLAVFDGDDEVDGIDVGAYSDFCLFRNAVVRNLEPRGAGTEFPTLILHSDCDGEWTPDEAVKLEEELERIGRRFRQLPAVPLSSTWQSDIAETFGIQPTSLCECFFDVDGESLLERLIELARTSQERGLPILFQ